MGKTFNVFLGTALCLTLVFGVVLSAQAQTSTGTDTTLSPGASATSTTGTDAGGTGTGGTGTTGTGGTGTVGGVTADPGFPNTGAGGDAPLNLVILSSSILVLCAGGILLSKRYAH